MIRIRQSVLLTCAFLLIFASACSGVTPAQKKMTLRVSWSLWQGDYTLLLADKLGYFAKQGIQVQPVKYSTDASALSDLASARLEGGLFSMSDTLLASNLVNLKVVMVSDMGGQYSLVGSQDINTLNDLRDKRIGLDLHTSSEIFIYDMLKTRRMTPQDVTYVQMTADQVIANIPSKIDAGLVWEPYTNQALKKGLKIIYQDVSESKKLPNLIVFRQSIIEKNPAEITGFLQAWDEAVQYRTDHAQDSLAIISKATGLSIDDLKLTGDIQFLTIKDNLSMFANTAGADERSIQYIAGFNRDFLLMEGYPSNFPHFSILLDPSFLK
jgi:NitT/TauT family transport system substrate-binding protein